MQIALFCTTYTFVRTTAPEQEQQATQMVYLLVAIHVIVCIFIIGVVLLQQGKSADLAGAFGGQGSQTAFGPRGAANLLTRLTTWSAVIFMLTTIGLYIALSHGSADSSVLSGTAKHATTQTAPAQTTPAAPAKK